MLQNPNLHPVSSFVSNILNFIDALLYENSAKLCEVVLCVLSPKEDNDLFNAVCFLWATSLFHTGRFKQVITVCSKAPNNIRCKYLQVMAMEKIAQYNECIEESLKLEQQMSNAGGSAKLPSDILSTKFSFPSENSVFSLVARCYKAINNLTEAEKFFNLAYEENSFDIEVFFAALNINGKSSLNQASLCSTLTKRDNNPSPNSSLMLSQSSPSSQMTASINKRLSISSSTAASFTNATPIKPTEYFTESNRKSGKKMLGAEHEVESTSKYQKKSCNKKLFNVAEENLPNKQHTVHVEIHRIEPPKQSKIEMSHLLELVCLYKKKFYLYCLKLVQDPGFVMPFTSPFILKIVADTFYENLMYEKSRQYYEMIVDEFPHFIRELEFYSSCLWHLKDKKTLSYLSEVLMSRDKTSEITWLTYGNLCSLKKDSQAAIKAFQRVVQIDSAFSYAHILMGYEYLASEDLQNALNSFYEAYKHDKSYKALFGMALVTIKEQQWENAEKYLLRSLALSPKNSVILYYVGMVYENMGRFDVSLKYLTLSIQIDASNFTARFKRARLLFKLGRLQDALVDAKVLAELDSIDPAVYLLIGRILREMGQEQEAVSYFTWGTSLHSDSSELHKGLHAKPEL